MNERIPTHLWVEAKIRECHNNGTPAFVVHKGNRTGGMVLLKLNNLSGLCRVLMQQRDLDGLLTWINPLNDDVPEPEADSYIAKERDFDEDLWILEIEDKDMKNPFEEKG